MYISDNSGERQNNYKQLKKLNGAPMLLQFLFHASSTCLDRHDRKVVAFVMKNKQYYTTEICQKAKGG